jgi:hypothetical protein
MGGRLGRNRGPTASDPFYNLPPPPAEPYPTVYDPSGGLGAYGPYEEYGYEPVPTMGMYGGPIRRPLTNYGGRYAQGEFQQ